MNGFMTSSAVRRDMVFDVGMYDGGDTAYYLHQGYRVVSIEADPELVGRARVRFVRELASGLLWILNVAIAAESGSATFWISDDKRVWNSLDQRIAARQGRRHHSIEVPAVRFRDVIGQFGVPYYLKIDIEGSDMLCVEDLIAYPLPPFISVEAECSAEGKFLSESAAGATLNLLHRQGYRRFKLISQRDFSAVDSTGRTEQGTLERGYPHRLDDTGPWGNETPGRWLTHEEAKRELAAAAGSRTESWHDWHATTLI